MVTTKRSPIEPLEQIEARLGEARSVVDAERPALSPQCCFATSVAGTAITAEAQRASSRCWSAPLSWLLAPSRDVLP
jgi:methionine synthase II (cobalamin-independent)